MTITTEDFQHREKIYTSEDGKFRVIRTLTSKGVNLFTVYEHRKDPGHRDTWVERIRINMNNPSESDSMHGLAGLILAALEDEVSLEVQS